MPLFDTDVRVNLSGPDGNAFAVMAIVSNAMRVAGADESEVEQFRERATRGDYAMLLATCAEYVRFQDTSPKTEEPEDEDDDDYTIILSPAAYRALCTLLLPGTHDIHASQRVWDELQRAFPERDADVEQVAA